MKKRLALVLATLFVLFSFTAYADETAQLENYSKGAPVKLGTVEDAEASKMTDGDLSTSWTTDKVDEEIVIEIDNGKILPIGYLEICWNGAPKSVKIESGSSLDSMESVLLDETDYSETEKTVLSYDIDTSRVFRITLRAPQGTSYGISEFVTRKTEAQIHTEISASYPSSGYTAKDDSVLITGTLIGDETGWGENAANGRNAAFDGNIETFFDPTNPSGNGSSWCGIDAGEDYVITGIMIHPREGQLGRFRGATIQAADNPDFLAPRTIFQSATAADEWTWVDCSDFIKDKNNTGYRYFRYINTSEWGDVAEIELYGYAGKKTKETKAPETKVKETEASVESTAQITEEITETSPNNAKNSVSPLVFIIPIVLIAAGVIAFVIIKKKKAQ